MASSRAGPVLDVIERLAGMDVRRIHPMHGGSLVKEIIPKYIEAYRRFL